MALTLGTNCGLVTAAPTADPAGTNANLDTWSKGLRVTLPAGGPWWITEIGTYIGAASEEATLQLGLYGDAGADEPEERLQYTSIAKGTTAGWKVAAGLTWEVNGSTTIWLAAACADTVTNTVQDYVSTGAGAYRAYLQDAPTLPSDWGASTGSANAGYYAIYAVYQKAPHALAGTAAGSATVAGDLTVEATTTVHELAGSVVAAAGVAGTLRATHAVAGAVAGSGTAGGALIRIRALAGATAAEGTAAGALTAGPELAGVIAGAAGASGLLSVVHAVAVSTAGSGSGAGSLAQTHSAGSVVSASAVLAGDLLRVQPATLWDLAGSVAGSAAVGARIQYKAGSYVPAQALIEPYPVPVLWNYLHFGDFEAGVQEWALDAQRWDEEHVRRGMQELSRLGQEKTAEWVEVA